MTVKFTRSRRSGLFCRVAVLLLILAMLLPTVACAGTEETEATESAIPADKQEELIAGLDEIEDLPSGTVNSDYVLLCERGTLTAVAGLRATTRMYPASMTKLMTFIVAYEEAEDREALIEITKELKNQYPEGSRVGIDLGDLLTVEQMMYALLLESDTDAALGLALHLAGSEAEFVALMNRKAEEMGLCETHFTNVTGLHNKEHYSTAADMAVILDYLLNIPLGREIITTERYVTWLKYYKNGELAEYRMTFKNTTLVGRFADNKVNAVLSDGTAVLGGKTGFTDEADYCLASLAKTSDGREYILITGHASSGEHSAKDAVKLYGTYAGE